MLTTRRRRHRTLHSASIPPILSYKQITFCSHDVASIHPHNCTVLHLLPHHQLLHCLYVLPPKISETSIFFIKKNEHEGASTWRPRPPCSKSDNKFETETTASTSALLRLISCYSSSRGTSSLWPQCHQGCKQLTIIPTNTDLAVRRYVDERSGGKC